MKKTLAALAFVAAGAIAVPSAFAQNAPTYPTQYSSQHDGWFVNGQVGRTRIDQGPYDGHDTGYQLLGGYRWAVAPSLLLGVEGGYNDLGNIQVHDVFNHKDVFNSSRSALHGWLLGADGRFNITPRWYAAARAGLYQWKGHGLSEDSNPLHRSLSKTDWYSGVGFGYNFTNNMSVGLNYDYYHADKDHVNLSTDMISVGADYRF